MENIQLQYPAWFIILCLAAGLTYALLLYYRDRRFKERGPQLNFLLGILRFFSVSTICLLLLAPLIKSLKTETQKPVIVIAKDRSESIPAVMDSAAIENWQEGLDDLADILADSYDVVELGFGGDVTTQPGDSFPDKITDMSAVISYIDEQYGDQNLGAVIMATDGIYNKGSNPLYQTTRFQAPLYAIALGDTSIRRDLAIKRVFHNKIAYLDDKFSVQADISGYNLPPGRTSLQVFHWNEKKWQSVDQRTLDINNTSYFQSEEVILSADKPGVQRYRFRVTAVPGEENTVNNEKDIFVDVLDARQKILILAHAPHPDLATLRQSIERNKNYEVSVSYAGEFRENLQDYDLLILHQLPSRRYPAAQVMSTARENGIPVWFIVGSATNISNLNPAQDVVQITPQGSGTNEVQAIINPAFSTFTLDERVIEELPRFVPVNSPFAEFLPEGGTQTLLYQKIGNIETQYPLLAYTEQGGQRQAILCAEGLWRWRLFDFLQFNNHNISEALVGKTIQFLSVKEDKRRFRINIEKNIFDENEPITFSAELYNAAYELVNTEDVTLIITDEEGREFDYTFDRRGNAYELNAGYFPAGNYRFRASVFADGSDLDYAGQFSVQPIQLEKYETTADHRLLALLSEKYGGQRIDPVQISQLQTTLTESENIKPVLYQTIRTRSVINLRWILFIIAAFLGLEWFIRRYYGSY